jgi:hypothetical protein
VLRDAHRQTGRSRPSAVRAACVLGGWMLGAAARRVSVRTGV